MEKQHNEKPYNQAVSSSLCGRGLLTISSNFRLQLIFFPSKTDGDIVLVHWITHPPPGFSSAFLDMVSSSSYHVNYSRDIAIVISHRIFKLRGDGRVPFSLSIKMSVLGPRDSDSPIFLTDKIVLTREARERWHARCWAEKLIGFKFLVVLHSISDSYGLVICINILSCFLKPVGREFLLFAT